MALPQSLVMLTEEGFAARAAGVPAIAFDGGELPAFFGYDGASTLAHRTMVRWGHCAPDAFSLLLFLHPFSHRFWLFFSFQFWRQRSRGWRRRQGGRAEIQPRGPARAVRSAPQRGRRAPATVALWRVGHRMSGSTWCPGPVSSESRRSPTLPSHGGVRIRPRACAS